MKRSKILLFSLALSLILVLLCACGEAPPPQNEHIHSFGDWVTSVQPTCTSEGEKMRSCDCGEYETATLPTASHSVVTNGPVAPTSV